MFSLKTTTCDALIVPTVSGTLSKADFVHNGINFGCIQNRALPAIQWSQNMAFVRLSVLQS